MSETKTELNLSFGESHKMIKYQAICKGFRMKIKYLKV